MKENNINNKYNQIFIECLISFLQNNKIQYSCKDNDLIYFKLKNKLQNILQSNEDCGTGIIDLSLLQNNFITCIGSFFVSDNIHPSLLYLTLNYINNYAVNFNISAEKQENSVLLYIKYNQSLSSLNKDSLYQDIKNIYNKLNYIVSSIVYFIVKELFNYKTKINFNSYNTLRYRNFIQSKIDEFDNKFKHLFENNDFLSYEKQIKSLSKEELEEEINYLLDYYKEENKDKLNILRKYLKK